MALPVFNIPYQRAYTSKIDFTTQINEMQLGQEQRYPVWTYPKRTFTLKFDKNASGRQELEDFYVDCLTNHGGQFEFTWASDKGGNDKTYICWMDTETLEMTIKDYGFCETELQFIAIDTNEIEQVDKLDFYHSAEADYSVALERIRDKVVTASYRIRNLWQAPRRSWTLKFDKTPAVRKQIEAFFIAKRGRFRYFEWTWEKERGGDGKTYNVRFDNDSLSLDIFEYGFSTFELQLKEVFPNKMPNGEYEKDEIIPRKLLNIDVEGGGVHLLDNETLAVLSYDGIDYIGAPLEHGEIKRDDNSAVDKLEIKVSNVGLGISGIISNRGDKITNAQAVLTMVLLNVNTNEIIADTPTILYSGKCNNLKINNEQASIDIETPLGGYEVICPVMRYRASCQVRRFKDVRCGYTGKETSCDRTYTRCKQLGNQANYRGCLSINGETVIKV